MWCTTHKSVSTTGLLLFAVPLSQQEADQDTQDMLD